MRHEKNLKWKGGGTDETSRARSPPHPPLTHPLGTVYLASKPPRRWANRLPKTANRLLQITFAAKFQGGGFWAPLKSMQISGGISLTASCKLNRLVQMHLTI